MIASITGKFTPKICDDVSVRIAIPLSITNQSVVLLMLRQVEE